MWGYYGEYVPVAKKRESAKKAMEKLSKKNSNISPVIIKGNKIAKTWWGIAWNKNLEAYADYSNRIARGRSYVRNGCVLDLQLGVGVVTALVQGSGSKPYKVDIHIAPLSEKRWGEILKICAHTIDGVEQLTAGKFPKEFESLFTNKTGGLFPSPKEIKFSCSCPDGAYMCKHVAATLYGIGARLDDDPAMFFSLRNVDFAVLLKKSLQEKMNSMLKNADQKTSRTLDIDDVSDMFGL